MSALRFTIPRVGFRELARSLPCARSSRGTSAQVLGDQGARYPSPRLENKPCNCNEVLESFRRICAGTCLAVTLFASCGDVSAKVVSNLPVCSNFTAAGGIEYCDSVLGSGDVPEAGDQIVVDYTGVSTATGKIYAGSRGFSFIVGDESSLIIEGWTRGILGGEGVPAVKVGGARTLRIPAELAFGARGDGCSFGLGDNCQVPPSTSVEVTFVYKGTKY